MRIKCILIIILAVCVCFSFLLLSCNIGMDISKRPDVPFTISENRETNSIELSCDGITYQIWGIVGTSKLCDKKIGFRDDGSKSTVFSVKGYTSAEWIINNPAESGFMEENSYLLFKAVGVTDIPSELEQYKLYE